MAAENSSDNIPRPELAKTGGHLLGDGFVKLIGVVVSAGVLAFGGWMTSMYSTQQELAQKSAEVSFKLDLLNTQLAEAKNGATEAKAAVRECERRLDRIEATRFTESDAAKALSPLEHRLERLESKRR